MSARNPHRTAMSIICPACGALQNRPCMMGGDYLSEPHLSRFRAAGVARPDTPNSSKRATKDTPT